MPQARPGQPWLSGQRLPCVVRALRSCVAMPCALAVHVAPPRPPWLPLQVEGQAGCGGHVPGPVGLGQPEPGGVPDWRVRGGAQGGQGEGPAVRRAARPPAAWLAPQAHWRTAAQLCGLLPLDGPPLLPPPLLLLPVSAAAALCCLLS